MNPRNTAHKKKSRGLFQAVRDMLLLLYREYRGGVMLTEVANGEG